MLVHNRLLFNEMSSVREIQLSSEQQTIMNCDSKFNDSFWSEVFKTVDKNHDGRINKKEFKKFMLTNGGKFTASDIKKYLLIVIQTIVVILIFWNSKILWKDIDKHIQVQFVHHIYIHISVYLFKQSLITFNGFLFFHLYVYTTVYLLIYLFSWYLKCFKWQITTTSYISFVMFKG
ncbi:unnamed protein product [Schistosoma mattheei]|uniref:EF-hand domain-containing protein n=1 Tax=Schistosoma mattheei TaxID=31246 RepID=A0AA85AZP5_9TREM|nr:unnamed protein product [Schistosoma mattheei]